MAKKIFGVYLAKLDAPNSEAHARLELPASPWELHDAMDKVQLQENEELYLEIDDYYGFEYLAPHLMELDAAWCSSDPVCIQSYGQGPESCNLAACHNCALLPETCCECGNRLLDRGTVVGTLDNKSIGFFAELLEQ